MPPAASGTSKAARSPADITPNSVVSGPVLTAAVQLVFAAWLMHNEIDMNFSKTSRLFGLFPFKSGYTNTVKIEIKRRNVVLATNFNYLRSGHIEITY